MCEESKTISVLLRLPQLTLREVEDGCWQGWDEEGPHTLLVGMQISTEIYKAVWKFFKTLNLGLSYEPTIPFLDMHLKERQLVYYKATYFLMFITQFKTAKIGNQPRYP